MMRGQQGSAIVISLLLMTVFLTIGSALLSVAVTENVIAGNEVATVRAFHAAEAGLEHGRRLLEQTDIDSMLGGGGQLLANVAIGTSTYSVVASNNAGPDFPRGGIPEDGGGTTSDTDGYLVLTSTGEYRSASQSVQVVVQADPAPGTEWAVFGDYFLSAHVTGSLDGLVGTNGDMILRVQVNGDAQAGRVIDNPQYVTGTATMGAPRVRFADVACPTGEYGPSPIGTGVHFDSYYGDLEIDGSDDTRFPAGTYYFFDFIKTGTGHLLVEAGDTVEIFVAGELDINEYGFLNANNAASRLRIWGCGTRNDSWRIGGNSPTWMFAYAPHHPMRILGTGTKNGSYIGASVFKSGAGSLVYDARLGTDMTGPYTEMAGSWTDLQNAGP